MDTDKVRCKGILNGAPLENFDIGTGQTHSLVQLVSVSLQVECEWFYSLWG